MFIQQVAKKLNITTRTIRHYEDLGIIKSKRLENNYRVYDTKNYDKLKFLVRARNLGFSLKECKELIKLFENDSRQSSSVREIAKKKLNDLKLQIQELDNLKVSLEWLVKKCPGNEKPNCPIIDELAKD
ncbi:MAG: Cu(I)-responsive transcriptional regulator [Pelagibacterales bacterium]|nr:Cu(I)-responsive transcriptional regulator [Pelagibacterales bacterium]|tara:strand:+ start:432 stop:818 length:387 start_codon:yes stop_codon:yes gene_type:complete